MAGKNKPIGQNVTIQVKHQKDLKLKQKEREYKKEVSRKASLANKRLKRLEKNNLTNLPAYQNFLNYKGGVKFSVKGKSHNELVAEMARLDHFINAKTSTVRGANATLRQIASNTNVSFKRVGELNAKLSKFFNLYSQVEQYLQSSLQIANAVGSDTVMKVVSDYVRDQEQTIKSGMGDYKDMVESIAKVLATKYVEDVENDFADDFTDLF
jgi:hypothetical protein